MFRNQTTTDASRFTYYKKSLERFKYARNKPINKPTNNFTIDYVTDEITNFQDYEQFRSLTTGFYATKSDCSMNKTVPMSILDGVQSTISFEDLIEFHEDPFYDDAAEVFDIQLTVDECKYGRGTLYPYGTYKQSPVINQYKFPTKVSITDCNSSLTNSDAIGAIGMRSMGSVRDLDPYADDYDTRAIAGTPAKSSEDYSHGAAVRDGELQHTHHLHMYPRHRRFVYYAHRHTSQMHDTEDLPFPNSRETISYAVFPRHTNASSVPDGFIDCAGDIKPFAYTGIHDTEKTRLRGGLPYETLCDVNAKIVRRTTIEQDLSKLNKIKTQNKNLDEIGNGAGNERYGALATSDSLRLPDGTPGGMGAKSGRPGLMSAIMASRSKGCSTCR